MLTVIGDLLEDLVVHTGTAPGDWQHGTDNPAVITRRRGGSAANVAMAAAPLVATRFIGRVGADDVGRSLTAELERAGIDVRVQVGGRTGAVMVMVDHTGERTMFPDRAASGELTAVAEEWLAGSTIVHIPAYGLFAEPMSVAVREAVHLARRLGARISLDMAAVSLVERVGHREFTATIAALAPDIVLANADEADALELAHHPTAPLTVIKHGPEPARIWHGHADGAWHEVPVPQPVDAVDTTGAGDAFAAGFLAALIAGDAPAAAVTAGHHAAARVLAAHRREAGHT